LGLAAVDMDFARRVHEGAPLAMTEGQRLRAQTALRPQYEFVADAFGVLPEAWRRNMKEATA
jgi:hypothetical protein